MAELIERKFLIRLGVTAVGELLAKLGLTAQKPLQRAYQRDPEVIEAWQRERYPALARQAKASGGEVYFWDGSGFRADSVHGETWHKKGQTPVVEDPGQRQSISAASAVNARGGFWYWAERRGVCLAGAANDAAAVEAGAFGARRTSRAQDHIGEDLCCFHKRYADAAFSSSLRA